MDKLREDVKDYLSINWNDEKTNKKIEGFITRGKAKLNRVAGVKELDFENEDLPRELLFDYCRYANSHALEMFEENFIGPLLELNLTYQVKGLKEEVETIENKT